MLLHAIDKYEKKNYNCEKKKKAQENDLAVFGSLTIP